MTAPCKRSLAILALRVLAVVAIAAWFRLFYDEAAVQQRLNLFVLGLALAWSVALGGGLWLVSTEFFLKRRLLAVILTLPTLVGTQVVLGYGMWASAAFLAVFVASLGSLYLMVPSNRVRKINASA